MVAVPLQLPPSAICVPPSELCVCFERDFVRQTFRAPRPLDQQTGADAGGSGVRYLQLQASGLCIDLRQDRQGEAHEAFLGLAAWDASAAVLNWHPVIEFGKNVDLGPSGEATLPSLLERVAASAAQTPSGTEDRGKVMWEADGGAWIETDVDGGAGILEERWVVMRAEADSGSPEAAFLRVDAALEEILLCRDGFFAIVSVARGDSGIGCAHFSMGHLDTHGCFLIDLSTEEQRRGSTLDMDLWPGLRT